MSKATGQRVLFQEQFSKPVVVEFDGEQQSTEGGALLLFGIDRQMGLLATVARELVDRRDPSRIEHLLEDLLRQRVFGIALGYADANDAQELRKDPVLKTVCGRVGTAAGNLGSQATISRFENTPSAREQVAMARAFERAVFAYLKKTHRQPSRITVDIDGSDDATHGQQVFSFFNGFYGEWCYQPLFGFISFDDDPQQYLFHARLRPGNARPSRNAIPLLRRTIHNLRRKFSSALIRVRLDAGFATPAILDLLDKERVEYVIAFPSNAVLLAKSEQYLAEARAMARETNQTARVFGEFDYQAATWTRPRRAVVKAEVVTLGEREPRDNPRFFITNMRLRPKRIHEIYRVRGDCENRIKELKLDLEIDRTSCTRYLANQFRVTQTALAYALYQQLRARLKRTELQRSTVTSLRHRLLKIGSRVVESVRRVVFHLPVSYPWAALWRRLASSLGGLIC